jgi:cysteine dioxygenase
MIAAPRAASVPGQGWQPLLTALTAIDFTTVDDARVAALFATLPPDEAALAPFLHVAADRYTRTCVHRDARFELLVLCWPAKVRSPVPGHGGSRGFITVCRGALLTRNYTLVDGGAEPGPARVAIAQTEVLRAGETGVAVPGRDVHDVGAHGSAAVSLHLYAAPLGHYLVYDIARGTCRASTSRDDVPPRRG